MGGIAAFFVKLFAGSAVQKVIKCVPAIVVEVEKAMSDGKITADERKDLALKTVDIASTQFGVQVTGIVRWVISMMIDKISAKLPSKDIAIPGIVLKIAQQW